MTGSRTSPRPRVRAPRWPGPTDASFLTTTPARPSGSSSTSCTGPSGASNAFAAKRRRRSRRRCSPTSTPGSHAALERFPFRDDLTMSEDQEWSRRALRAGFSLVYEPRAAVRHSHAYTIRSAFTRFFDSGVSAEHAYVEGDASRAALRRAGGRYARAELRGSGQPAHRRWIPYTAAYELGKYAGLQLGLRHARLPRSLVRRLGSYETDERRARLRRRRSPTRALRGRRARRPARRALRSAAPPARGHRRGRPPPRRCEEGSTERRNPARGRAAPLRGLDARLHARPPRRRQGRAGCPARVLRPCSGAALSRPCGRAGRVRRGRGATERRAAAGCDRRLVARRRLAVDRAGRRAGRGARGGSPGGDRAPRALCSPSAPTSSASLAVSCATTPSRRRPKRSRPASTTTSTGERRASGRTWTTSRSAADDRDLRRFGSQGEQRLAVLSLILAEAALLAERGPAPPLLLLDDVLSELDEGRRAALAERLAGPGQTLITATAASALPAEPAQLVEVTPGAAR